MKAFFTCEQKLGNTIFTFSQKAKVLSTSPYKTPFSCCKYQLYEWFL